MVECAGLENRYGQKPIEGSNPSLSASTERRAAVFWCLCWGQAHNRVRWCGMPKTFTLSFMAVFAVETLTFRQVKE